MNEYNVLELRITIEGSLFVSDNTETIIRRLKWTDTYTIIDVEGLQKEFNSIYKKYDKIKIITIEIIKDYSEHLEGIRYIFDYDRIEKRGLADSEYHGRDYVNILKEFKEDKKEALAKKDINKELLRFLNRLNEIYAKLLLDLQKQQTAG